MSDNNIRRAAALVLKYESQLSSRVGIHFDILAALKGRVSRVT